MQSRIDSQKVCTGCIPGDVGTQKLRQEFVGIGTSVVRVGEDAGIPDQRLPNCGRRIRHEDEIDTER